MSALRALAVGVGIGIGAPFGLLGVAALSDAGARRRARIDAANARAHAGVEVAQLDARRAAHR